MLETAGRERGGAASDAAIALVLRVVGAVLGLGVTLATARLLTADGMGRLTLAMSVIVLPAVGARLGFDSPLLRRLAAADVAGDQESARAALRWVLVATGITGALATGVLCAAAGPLAEHLFDDPAFAAVLRMTALAIVPIAWTVLLGEALKARFRIALALLVQSVVGAGASLALLLIAQSSDTTTAAGIITLGPTVAAAVGLVLAARGAASAPRPGPAVRSSLRLAARPLLWAALGSQAMLMIDVLVLGVVAEPAVVAYYGVAVRLTAVASMFLSSVNASLGPRFAAADAAGDTEVIGDLVRRTTQVMVASALALAVGAFLLATPVLSVFGENFEQGATALRILAIGQAVALATGPMGVLLVMTGREQRQRQATMIGLGVAVVGALALTPPFSATGAAVAAASGLAAKNLVSWYFGRAALRTMRAAT